MYSHMKEQLEFIEKTYPLFKNGTSKREIRHNFFSEIKTELQAYLLGFIYSDGSINDERHTLTIHINEKDKEIFNLFKVISPEAYIQDCKGYESKVTVDGRTVKNLGSTRLSISSKILLEDLHNLGVVENKTYKELHIPKQIPNELIKHFIRGYFDGDGHISKQQYKYNMSIVGTQDFCDGISTIIEKELQLFPHLYISSLEEKSTRTLMLTRKNDCKMFFDWIYEDASLFLKRKYDVYLDKYCKE